MKLGICHAPLHFRYRRSPVIEEEEFPLLEKFNFVVPRGYLCPPTMLTYGDLVEASLRRLRVPVYGHALVPMRKEHLPRDWGGYAPGSKKRTVGVVELRKLKKKHVRSMLDRFRWISNWTLTLENFKGTGVAVDHDWQSYYADARRFYPDSTYAMSETLGTSYSRWQLIFDEIRYAKHPPDRLAVQLHVRHGLDVDNSGFVHIDLLDFVLDNSPVPIDLSEVCYWFAEEKIPWDKAIAFTESLLLRKSKFESFVWWHWRQFPVWFQPGRPYGIPVIAQTGSTTDLTPMGQYLLSL